MRRLAGLVAAVLGALVSAQQARALDAVVVTPTDNRIALFATTERYEDIGAKLTLKNKDGGPVITAQAKPGNGSPGWMVFALKNSGDEPLVRWLVVENSGSADAGLVWPNPGTSRVVNVTTTADIDPKKLSTGRHDIYQLTLPPDKVVTFVAEIAGRLPSELTLWSPRGFEAKANSLSFFQGLLTGLTGLLAIFLTTLYVLRRKLMYPAAALTGWAALLILGSEFGLWRAALGFSDMTAASIRAIGETMFAGALAALVFTFLELTSRFVVAKRAAMAIAGGLVLVAGLALFAPSLALGLARFLALVISAAGAIIAIFLATKGSSRATALATAWSVLIAFQVFSIAVFAGTLAQTTAAPLYAASLVLVVMVVAFTVMQYAFAADMAGENRASQLGLKAVAFSASGLSEWDWSVTDERISVDGELEIALGLEAGALNGDQDRWLSHIHTLDKDRFIQLANTAVSRSDGILDTEFRFRTSLGEIRWYHLAARAVARDGKQASRFIGAVREITAEKNARERLLRDAVNDALTGLPNRALFNDRLERAIQRVRDNVRGARRPSVIVLDIDRFKNVNDSFGHAVGDSMIAIVAQRLSELVMLPDTLARVQGDQFAAVITSIIRQSDLEVLASDLRQTLKEPIFVNDREVFLTASIGISTYDDEKKDDANALFRASELAMVHARSKGPDHIETYQDTMHAPGSKRIEIESDLRRALERQEIELVYQPIMRFSDDRIAGFEALMRWRHPEDGLKTPDEFIGIAEETGIIVELGHFAMDTAARQLTKWLRTFSMDAGLFISVNVSSRQIFRQDLMRDVRMIMSRNDIPDGALRLEITESLVMENPELATYVLDQIRALGAGLALDDFGTGFSALSYLQRFAFDTLKVDKSFVTGATDARSPVILKSIVALAHDLGMQVVAEGIESAEDVARLKSIGCDMGQGFHFSPPLSPQDAVAFLAEWK
ncbi:MAG: EAL domain-containing protein [Alphaproteobacteria bacterium]